MAGGALFLDAANRYNPVPHLYELNPQPCGERLGHYENCCLGSINLAQMLGETAPWTGKSSAR